MKRDEMYYAREDIAFNRWVDARRDRLAELAIGLSTEAVRDLVRSAFISGVRFGSEEADIQSITSQPLATTLRGLMEEYKNRVGWGWENDYWLKEGRRVLSEAGWPNLLDDHKAGIRE